MAARRLTMLFAALALLALALRAGCDLLPAQAAGSSDPAVCCASLEHGDAFASPDLASPGTGAKALAVPPAIAYFFAGAATLLRVALLYTSAARRPRSFYARSTRLLR